MKPVDLFNYTLDLTEENYSTDFLVDTFNHMISSLNVKANSKFPLLTVADISNEYPLDQYWLTVLSSPFISAQIRFRDNALNEYSALMSEFFNQLSLFVSQHTIPDDYKNDSETNPRTPTFSGYLHRRW